MILNPVLFLDVDVSEYIVEKRMKADDFNLIKVKKIYIFLYFLFL